MGPGWWWRKPRNSLADVLQRVKDGVESFLVEAAADAASAGIQLSIRSMKSRMSRSRSAERSRRIAHFVQDPVAHSRLQGLRRRKVHGPSEDFSQAVAQSSELEEIWRLMELNEDVDVAIGVRFASGHRPVYPKPAHASARQLGAMGLNSLEENFGGHGKLV